MRGTPSKPPPHLRIATSTDPFLSWPSRTRVYSHRAMVLRIEESCLPYRREPNMVSGGAFRTPSKPPFEGVLNALQTNTVFFVALSSPAGPHDPIAEVRHLGQSIRTVQERRCEETNARRIRYQEDRGDDRSGFGRDRPSCVHWLEKWTETWAPRSARRLRWTTRSPARGAALANHPARFSCLTRCYRGYNMCHNLRECQLAKVTLRLQGNADTARMRKALGDLLGE